MLKAVSKGQCSVFGYIHYPEGRGAVVHRIKLSIGKVQARGVLQKSRRCVKDTYLIAARPCNDIRDAGKFVCCTRGSLQRVPITVAIDIRIQTPCWIRMTTIWPGRCGNLFPVLKQTDGISLAEAKAEACRSAVILINYKISVCWNGCSFWNGVGILILIILQHKTGNAQLISCGIGQLHPVWTAAWVIGLYFIDDHRVHDFILLVLSGCGKILKFTGTIRDTGIDAVCVGFPCIFGDDASTGIVNHSFIVLTKSEGKIFVLIKHIESTGFQCRSICHRGNIPFVSHRIVVQQIPSGNIYCLSANVHDFHPIGCVTIGLDLVNHNGWSIICIGCSFCLLGQAKLTRAIGITPVRCFSRVTIIGCVFRPAVLIQQFSAFIVQSDRITGADANCLFKCTICKTFCLVIINQSITLGIHYH